MFWFWFIWGVFAVLIVVDVAWWIFAARLLKSSRSRAVVWAFLGAQTLALVSVMCDWNLLRHAPKSIQFSTLLWHYFALTVLFPLLLIGIGVWIYRKLSRANNEAPISAAETSSAPALDGNTLSRRRFIGFAAALAPPALNLGLVGVGLAQMDDLRVRRFTLGIPTLPKALDGLTIAHVTDMHVGGLTSEGILRKMVRVTNDLRPDLVLLTGDLIDARLSDLSAAMDFARAMQGRYGQWMIEGNHDLFENEGEFKRRVRAAGIPFLANESAVTEIRGHPVQLFGSTWIPAEGKLRDQLIDAGVRELMRQRQPDAFPILLAHHPHAFDAAIRANLPLTLSGHTHGGQWMFNERLGVGPMLFRYWSGLYSRGRSHMIVSNGVGNVFPIRVNAQAEVVHLTLKQG